jgi:pimeloyl-ACP methyl ester carboxylesterase
VRGDGPTVLVVHGMLVDGRLFDGVAELLAAGGARVLQPDLPLGAHQQAVPDRRRLDPPTVAAALVDLLDGLGEEGAVLVGSDTGAGLCQVAAAAYADRFHGLVLLSGDAFCHFPPTVLRPLQPLARMPSTVRLLVRLFGWAPLFARPSRLNLLCRKPVDPALVRSWLAPALRDRAVAADLGAFFRSISPRYTLEAAEALRAYPHPAVVAWSRGDRLFPPADGEALAALIPRARLVWIEDSLGLSPLDQPAAVAEAVASVLEEVAAEAQR